MITKSEILELASSFSLQPTTVQKDYVLGWLLRVWSRIEIKKRLKRAVIFDGRNQYNSKIQSELGWSHNISFKNGLNGTVKWYLEEVIGVRCSILQMQEVGGFLLGL